MPILRRSSVPIIAVAMIATGIASMAADQERDRAEKLRQQLQEAHARLKLSDAQIERIRPILRASTHAQIKVLEKHGVDIGDRSEERRRQLGFRQLRQLGRDLDRVRGQTIRDLGAVLNEAQVKEYKQIQKERKQALRKRLRQRRR